LVLSVHDYDLTEPLSAINHAKLAAWTVAAKWRWRNYAQEDLRFISRLKETDVPIDTIWDIGASNGAWALMVARHFSETRVEMFEPLVPFDKSYYDVMRYRLATNALWRLHPLALGSTIAEATIYVADQPHGSSFIVSDYAKENWRHVNVKISTMDEMIESEGLPTPDIIKADTQGFELEILKGGVRHIGAVRALLLETWLSRSYGPQTPLLEEMMEWLKPHGFVLAEVNTGYRDPSGTLHSVDAFFLQKDIAKSLGLQI